MIAFSLRNVISCLLIADEVLINLLWAQLMTAVVFADLRNVYGMNWSWLSSKPCSDPYGSAPGEMQW